MLQVKEEKLKRKKTPSFVVEIPIKTDSKQMSILDARLEAGRQLYNAVLGEAKTRLDLVRFSSLYESAKKIPKTNKKARNEAFQVAKVAYRYSEYDMHDYAEFIAASSGWINQHLDSFTIQKVATRAFKATERLLFGKAKLVRFKGKGQFASLEGKSNKSGIRWKGDFVEWNTKSHKLTLKALIDKHDSVIAYGLSCPIKYVRLVRRTLNQKTYWYAQLVCEGLPLQKKAVNTGLVGIDLGVSTVAIVGDDQTLWLPFVPELDPQQKEIRRLQRQMERQKRANNPDNYNPDFIESKGRKKKGKVKKGSKKWNNSRRYKKTSAKKREIERKQRTHRRSLHGRLVNRVLGFGKSVKMEKVSVKGWQKLFGSSIGYKAPSFFQSELVRKAESAGGQVVQFSTQKTALSQVCLCGNKQKKPLSLRVHECKCGIKMQRDIFSAFLSRYVDPTTETLSIELARNGWLGMEPSLRAGWQNGSIKPTRAEALRTKPPREGLELVACDLIGRRKSESVGQTKPAY